MDEKTLKCKKMFAGAGRGVGGGGEGGREGGRER